MAEPCTVVLTITSQPSPLPDGIAVARIEATVDGDAKAFYRLLSRHVAGEEVPLAVMMAAAMMSQQMAAAEASGGYATLKAERTH